jgi:hypothetical protein
MLCRVAAPANRVGGCCAVAPRPLPVYSFGSLGVVTIMQTTLGVYPTGPLHQQPAKESLTFRTIQSADTLYPNCLIAS